VSSLYLLLLRCLPEEPCIKRSLCLAESINNRISINSYIYIYCKSGLVVRVPGYRFGGPGFDSRALQEKKVVGLERGPLSLVSTTEELFGRNSSGSGLESREYGRRDSSR
jgi:hypothetical protein